MPKFVEVYDNVEKKTLTRSAVDAREIVASEPTRFSMGKAPRKTPAANDVPNDKGEYPRAPENSRPAEALREEEAEDRVADENPEPVEIAPEVVKAKPGRKPKAPTVDK